MIEPLDLKVNSGIEYDLSNNENKKKKSTLWEKLFRRNKLEKPKTVAVLYLKDNNRAIPMEIEPKNGFFNIEGRTYHERKDCTYTLMKGRDKYPLAIIPEKNLTPKGTSEWDEKPAQEKMSELQDHVIKGIRHAEMVKIAGDGSGMKLNKTIVMWAIIIIIVGAVAYQYLPGLFGGTPVA